MSSKKSKPAVKSAPTQAKSATKPASTVVTQEDDAIMPDIKKKSQAKPAVAEAAVAETKKTEAVTPEATATPVESAAATNPSFDANAANVLSSLVGTANPVTPVAVVDSTVEDEDDTETTSGSLNADLFDLVPSATAPTGVSLTIKLFGPGCLECQALVEDGAEPGKRQPCHFSRGNTNCPASSARIEFVGERITYLSRIRKARDGGDSNRLIRLMTELENKPLSFKTAVLTELGLLQPKS